jgi:predicted nucleotide-binding protein
VTSDELRSFLRQQNVKHEERALQHGIQFRCGGGEIFVVYNTGKLVTQGAATELTSRVKILAEGGALLPAASTSLVFIVYGHDVTARNDLELVIRRMGLEPVVLQNLPAKGETVIEKLEHYIGEHGKAGFACVLLTPDDEGHKAGVPEEKKYRARQNVVLELGMVLAGLGRERVAILRKESVDEPSDMRGLIYIPL